MPGAASMARILITVDRMSPSADTRSLSKNLPKKCRASSRNCDTSFWRAGGMAAPLRLHYFHDVFGDLFGIFLQHQLRKNIFKRGQFHEVPQVLDRVVCHHHSLAQNDHAAADLLDDFEYVRAVQNGFSLPRQRLDETLEDQSGSHVKA